MLARSGVYKSLSVFVPSFTVFLPSSRPCWPGKSNTIIYLQSSIRFVKKNCFEMKVATPEFKQILTDELKILLDIFDKNNYDIRIAGGAVRDLLLGITPSDIDFATNATPDEMKQMFTQESVRMINAKGEKHGTITARINNCNFEVTTLRIDVVTDGRHAEVEFTKDWELDANRRDFTVNSMFLGPDGTLYDYCDGYSHLKEKKIIFVGDARKRIKEDYLRILRYFRFYGKICQVENDHDEETLRIISENIDGLSQISGERILVELKKIVLGNFAASLTAALIKCGASRHIGIPENADIKSMKILLEMTRGVEVSPITILSSLFESVDQFLQFHSRCKLSNQEKNLGIFIIENRLYDEPLKHFQTILLTPKQPPVTRQQITELFKYRGDITKLNHFENWETPKMPINGNDLLELGVPPGKPLGNIMNRLKIHWINNDFKSDKQLLLQLVSTISEEMNIKLNCKNV